MKLKGKNYFALICDSGIGKDRFLICGVYGSKKEAQEVNEDIKDCPAKHSIKECDIEISLK
jgi:hypothetical protein